ncbi:MAG: acetylxylan esterase [Fimbriimonadales bacterium]
MSYAIPADFDSFWADVATEAGGVEVDFERRPTSYQPLDTHRIELLDFVGAAGRLHGWVAVPKNVGQSPGFVWIPAYGRESHLPDEYSTREGFVSFSFNFHGHAAFHKEEYKPERGYFSDGVDDPQTWIFRRMAMDCLVAMRVLAAQPEIDAERLAAAGLSQGGGMAIWAGAHSPLVKRVVADLPFLSDMGNTLGKDIYRFPLKELTDYAESSGIGMDAVRRTISYFDTAHQATRLTKPVLVSLGEKDPAVKPASVRAVFAALASEDKRLIEYPTGHDWHPGMIEANREFLIS